MTEGPAHREGFVADCEAHLGQVPGAINLERRNDGLWMRAPEIDVQAMAEMMNQLKARLSTITGVAIENGETEIIYHFCLSSLAINIKTQTRDRAIPSVTPLIRVADWSEREIFDLYGVHFTGHPNLVRLIRPPALPPGFFRNPDKGGSRGEEQTSPNQMRRESA